MRLIQKPTSFLDMKGKKIMSKKPKILLFDIETTNLKANRNLSNYYPQLLCFGYKWYGEKEAHVLDVTQHKKEWKRDHHSDKALLAAVRPIMAQADVIVGHYSTRFDLRYLNSRLLHHKMKPVVFKGKHRQDTWMLAKDNLAMHSNRLNELALFLGKEEKDRTDVKWWYGAVSGDASCIKKLSKYCKQDVQVLEQVWTELIPFASLPTMYKEGCPSCGSKQHISNGRRFEGKSEYTRLQCTSCGSWYKGHKL